MKRFLKYATKYLLSFFQAISALVQPFGVCAEYLNSSVVQVKCLCYDL